MDYYLFYEYRMNSTWSIYTNVFKAASMIPPSHYFCFLAFLLFVFLYIFLEFHILQDILSGFCGYSVNLTLNSCSKVFYGVASQCSAFHGRYFVTPWLSSPHFQTMFLHFFGRPPSVDYERQIFQITDGGTLALDWVSTPNGSQNMLKDDPTPIVIVIPGLTSDSSSAYIKHFAFRAAKQGWRVVISNHRGLGGISVTSDCFYNAGWTNDVREVIKYVHEKFPKSPLFVVGTSIGANILVKFLGEDGDGVLVAGAAAICSPWDLLIGDRFIKRRFLQKLYDRALTIGLQGYAHLHQTRFSQLADWEGIVKSRSVRDFDHHATRVVGKFETVDTYYRQCSSVGFLRNVSAPLLCINSLDDPVCSKEAIPWDECRANPNIILATTPHGGHLAFFEGITASTIWWVGATIEFFDLLYSTPCMHIPQKTPVRPEPELSMDEGPYLNMEDGLVAPASDEMMECQTKRMGPCTEEEESETRFEKRVLEANSLLESSLRSCSTIVRWSGGGRSLYRAVFFAVLAGFPFLAYAFFFFKRSRPRPRKP